MHKIQRQVHTKSRLAQISQVKLNRARSALVSAQQHLSQLTESLDKAKASYESTSENTCNYLAQGNICPVRLHHFHSDLRVKAASIQNKEKEYENALSNKNAVAEKYLDAVRINDFWQDKMLIAVAEISALKQRKLDASLSEIYLNNARMKNDR